MANSHIPFQEDPMKRAISCTCLAAAFAVGLSAQTPSTSAAAQSDKDTKTITVTGCLKAGDAPGSFVLANIKTADKDKAGASTTATTATTGATGTAGSTTTTTTVSKDLENATASLTGSPAGVTLSDHVGHMVQITGALAPQSAAASATAGTAGANPPAEPGAASASASKAQPTINVTAFSMVAGTCSM
jgi:hypothetical protein